MISLQDLKVLCIDRLEDAKILQAAQRHDGAFYMSGYVVELALKKKICEILNWDEFPSKGLKACSKLYKTHDLEILLQLAGMEKMIKSKFFTEWSIVTNWNPEKRYSSRSITAQSAQIMIQASETLLKNL